VYNERSNSNITLDNDDAKSIKSYSKKHKNKKINNYQMEASQDPFVSDEEERLLQSYEKNQLSMNSLVSEFSACESNEKLSAYFLMFCNICRSFIAIGVLSVPYGLSKCGKNN
jgi:hypothetical protein